MNMAEKAFFCILFSTIMSSTLSTNLNVNDLSIRRNVQYIELARARINSFKSTISKILEEEHLKRDKREVTKDVLKSDFGSNSLLKRNFSDSSSSENGEKKLVVIGARNGSIYLIRNKVHHVFLFGNSTEQISILKLQTFFMNNELWLTVHFEDSGGTEYLLNLNSSIKDHEQPKLSPGQRILLHGKSITVGVPSRNSYYLAAISSGKRRRVSTFSLYKWRDSQFDRIFYYSLMERVKSLAMWDLDSTLYVSVLLNSNKSLIFECITAGAKRRLAFVQLIEVYSALFFKHFAIEDYHYLVFVKEKSADIFQWSGIEFLAWQKLNLNVTGVVLDAITLKHESQVLLAFASYEEIEYFSQDATSFFVKILTKKFSEDLILKNISAWQNICAYSILSQLLPVPQDVVFSPISASRLNPLVRCLKNVRSAIDSREKVLDKFHTKLSKVWLRNATSKIKANVMINGVIKGGDLRSKGIIISTDNKSSPSLLPRDINDKLDDQMKEIEVLKTSQVMRKSNSQLSEGELHFMMPIVIAAGFLQISVSLNPWINGIPVSKFGSVLRKSGDQQFDSVIQLLNLEVDEMNIRNSLNNASAEDFVLLSGKEFVNGSTRWQYVNASNLYLAENGLINGLHLKDILKTFDSDIVTGMKTFARLTANSINSRNQLNLSTVAENAIYVDVNSTIENNLNFTLTTVVDGHLSIASLMGTKIEDLNTFAFKNGSSDVIHGKKIFSEKIDVYENVQLIGSMNRIQLEDIFDLIHNQNITGKLFFSNFTCHRDLEVGSVNNIDISSDTIHRGNEFIEVRKEFFQPLKVIEDIKMTEGDLMDGVDPSEMKVLTRYEKAVFENTVSLKNISVENINISKNSGFLIPTLEEQVWFKSKNQDIISCVRFQQMTIKDMNIQKLNDDPFNKNYVTVAGNHSITMKTFNETVFTKSFKIKPNVRINEMLLPFGDVVLSSRNHLSYVFGRITFQNLVITGSIGDLSLLNGVNFPEGFVRAAESENFNEKLKFLRVKLDNLNAWNIDFTNINNINFLDYIHNSARKNASNQRPIINKAFKNIYGAEMISEGLINDINLRDFMRRVITVNTEQGNITYKSFASVDVQQLKTVRLFNLSFSDIVEGVVKPDENKAIRGSKRFQKTVQFENLEPQFLNGLNLTLLEPKVMFKTKPNAIWGNMTFRNNVTFNSGLQVFENQTIDGIPMVSFFKLNNSEYFPFPVKFSNITIEGNIFINGLINECNLTQVLNNILLLKGDVQVLSAKQNLAFLKIFKNLDIQHAINNVFLDQLNKTIVNCFQNGMMTSQNFCLENISVNNLFLPNPLNKISFLTLDAVKNSVIQDISGYKLFVHMNATQLNVTSVSTKNDSYMLKTAVMKHEYQLLENKLKIAGVNSTNTNILGKLNELKIPKDLILTNTTDVINSSTYFNTSVSLNLNLTVDGTIDDVIMALELESNLLLNSNGSIFSDLIFKQDVYIIGNLTTPNLNKIHTGQFILRNETSVIHGIKNIHDTLITDGSIVVSEGINDVDVLNLHSEILKKGMDENVTYLHFSSAIFATVLDVDKDINSISLDLIWSDIHEKMEAIEHNSSTAIDLYNDHQEFFNSHISKISVFAYFELYQRIDIGSTIYVLPILKRVQWSAFNVYHSSLVIWIDNCSSESLCCENVTSLRMAIQTNGTLISEKHYEGRIFQYTLRNTAKFISGFILQNKPLNSNVDCRKQFSTWMKTCYGEVKKPKTVKNLGNVTSLVSDAKYIEMEQEMYVIVLYDAGGADSAVKLYQYDWTKDQWNFHQQLDVIYTISIDLMYVENGGSSYIFLAVSSNNIDVPLSIYQWSTSKQKFFDLETVTSVHVSSTVFWVDNGNDMFLLCAGGKSDIRKDNSTVVQVYTDAIHAYQLKHSLVFYQLIDLRGVTSFDSFKLSDETFILAVSPYMQTVYVIKWKGYSGFEVIQAIPAPGVSSAAVFFLKDEQVMMAITSRTGHTKILKCITRSIILFTD